MDPRWRKSTRSGNDANCVELALTGGVALIRDSKSPDHGHLAIPAQSLTHLIHTTRR